jgi:hypothetical protein
MTSTTHHDHRPFTPGAGEPRGHRHRLAAGGIFGVSIQQRARVTCLTGELWVTGPDTGDQILEPGQSVCIQGTGRVVVEALTPAEFTTRLEARVAQA